MSQSMQVNIQHGKKNYTMAKDDYYFVVLYRATVTLFNTPLTEIICGGFINDSGNEFDEAMCIKETKENGIIIHEILEIIPFEKDINAGRSYVKNFDLEAYKVTKKLPKP